MPTTPIPTLPPNDASEIQVVCTILAAQAAALRHEVSTGASVEVELLYQIAESIAEAAASPENQLCEDDLLSALPGKGPMDTIDAFALAQAQHFDLVSQMADFLATALERLATGPGPLNEAELASLYVSEKQRLVHAETISQAKALASRR